MDPALFRLMRLQFSGWFRHQFLSGSRTRRAFAVVGILFFFAWSATAGLGAAFFDQRTPREILDTLPLYLTAFGLLPILVGSEDRAIAFTPAEVDFLFAGPFSRRQIVGYKLLKLAFGAVAGSLFFSLWAWRWATSYFAALLGAALTLVFVNLLSTVLALVEEVLEDGGYEWTRRAVRAALVLVGAWLAWWVLSSEGPLAALHAIATSPVARLVTAPARVFAHVFAATSPLQLLGWSAGCMVLITSTTVCVFALDHRYLEAALAATQRRQERITRFARSGIGALGAGGEARRIPLPELTFLGGAGAIVRRQILTAIRTSRGWMLFFGLLTAYAVVVMRLFAHGEASTGKALAAMMPGAVLMLVLLPQILRFDFRADLDQIDHLKTLPLRPIEIVLAELATPAGTMVGLAWLLVAVAKASFALPLSIAVGAALGVVPIAMLLVGLENFAFLVLPTRLLGPNQAVVAFSGRRILLMLTRFALAGVGGGFVAIIGSLVAFLTHSPIATYGACWIATLLLALGVAAAVAWAFRRFDVSRDMPG